MPPSLAPMVTINTNDNLNSFTVGISSTDPASCIVTEYNVTLTDSMGESLFAVVPANVSSFNTESLFGTTLELCSQTYNFMIVASSGGPAANMSGEINFQSKPS